MAANIARKRCGGLSEAASRTGAPRADTSASDRPAAGGCAPAAPSPPAAGLPARRRARPLPRGSNQLVIASHFLPARALEPHGHLAVKGVTVDVAFHGGGFRLAMSLDDHVVLRDTGLGEYRSNRLGTTT
jgi:hypothetical protein